MMEFPCNRCGICCRNVHLSKETAFLNRSDGVCINFDELTHLCKIYENRPLVCRIREYYLENLSNIYTLRYSPMSRPNNHKIKIELG